MADIIERLNDRELRITRQTARKINREDLEEQLANFNTEIGELETRRDEVVALLGNFTVREIREIGER